MELRVIFEHEEMRDMVVHVNSEGLQKIMTILADESNIIVTQLTPRALDASLRCASDLHQFPGDYSECPFCGATLRQ